jgi:alkaline phosphatase D
LVEGLLFLKKICQTLSLPKAWGAFESPVVLSVAILWAAPYTDLREADGLRTAAMARALFSLKLRMRQFDQLDRLGRHLIQVESNCINHLEVPMRIAFVSCFHSQVFPVQPVWDWIKAQQPDHLVLLGDSIYLDVNAGALHPSMLSDDDFAQRLFRLYSAQMNQPAFKGLVKSMPNNSVWSIWDDHDFLWNDATGDLAKNPVHQGKIRLSTAFQEAFRTALAASFAPDSFPDVYNRAEFWDANQPTLSTPSVRLDANVWLHLSDGRTERTQTFLVPESRRHLLGGAQRNLFQARVLASVENSVHLFASGSTLSTYKKSYPADWRWLTQLASSRRTLVLSGDIHRNESDANFTAGWPLHEATSSGVAVKDAVIIGTTRRNYGIVDIGSAQVKFRLFADNKEEKLLTRTLSCATWLPV